MTRHTSVAQNPYWHEESILFTGSFRYYHQKPQKVWAKFHTSDERYYDIDTEIVPIKTPHGNRTYVHMQPFIVEPNLVLTVALEPKRLADLGDQIGSVQKSELRGTRDAILGNAQAWYYPADTTIVIWECFFERRFRDVPLVDDENMCSLWRQMEAWLLNRFPDSTRIVTPFDDPIVTREEYQTFLRSLGYIQVAKAAFGKTL